MGQIWDGSEEIFLKMRIAPPPAAAARHHISVSFRDADGAMIESAVEGEGGEKHGKTAFYNRLIALNPRVSPKLQYLKKITAFHSFQL